MYNEFVQLYSKKEEDEQKDGKGSRRNERQKEEYKETRNIRTSVAT